jgi:N-acetylmuramoyl-L-alanine amidase
MRLMSSLAPIAIFSLLSGTVAVGTPSHAATPDAAPPPPASHETVVDLTAPSQVPGAMALSGADRTGAAGRTRSAASPRAPDVQVTGASQETTVAAPLVVVGVTWRQGTGREATVQYRTREKERWTAWTFLDAELEHSPDLGSAEASKARTGTDALVVTNATAVQVRTLGDEVHAPAQPRLMVVDPGGSARAPSAGPALLATPVAVTAPAATTVTTAGAAVVPRPAILTRAQWGADERLRRVAPVYAVVKGAFVHHTVNANSYTAAQVPGIIRAMYAYHVNGLGWNDIGYNFLIDRFGRIWEGRYGGMDRPVVGAQTLNHNAYSFGASAIGNFDVAAPPSAVTAAFTRLIGWKAQVHRFNPAGSANMGGHTLLAVSGHRDAFATACPGRFLYAKVPAIRAGAAALARPLP